MLSDFMREKILGGLKVQNVCFVWHLFYEMIAIYLAPCLTTSPIRAGIPRRESDYSLR